MKTNKNISAIAIMKKKQSIDKEGARLIRALIIISIIGLLAMFTNKASAQVRFSVQGDLVSSYVWRGRAFPLLFVADKRKKGTKSDL